MSLEQSIYELTVAVNKLISIHEKYNQDSNADLSSVITPVIKMASEIIMEPEPAPTPTVKPVKKVSNPTPVATADEPVGTAMNIVEMRDAIRTMCSEMVQSDKKNKVGIEDIFLKFKATHLKMVNDATVPALYAELMAFKGALK
jgi:hypothetical protein